MSEAFQQRIRHYGIHLLEASGGYFGTEEVEDLIQDLNLILWRRMKKYDAKRLKAKPFLSALLNRYGPEVLRKYTDHLGRFSGEEVEFLEFCPARYELPVILSPILARLNGEMRQHFKYFLEWDHDQIAQETGWNRQRAYYYRKRLAAHPALQRLKYQLEIGTPLNVCSR